MDPDESALRNSHVAGYAVDTARIAFWLSTCTAALLFTVLMTSFQPFISGTSIVLDQPSGPNTLNQVGFSMLAMISIAGMAMIANRDRVAVALDPAWLLIAVCLAFSAFVATDSTSAARAVLFNLIIIVICIGVVAIPHSAAGFRLACAGAVLSVIVISYLGVLWMPSIAVHLDGGVEAQHAGLWRGVFSHKNVAGPVFAAFTYFGIYLMRSGLRHAGFIIVLLSILFIIQTGSKTTNGLVVVAFAIAISGRIFGSRLLPVMLLAVTFALAAAFTIGTVIHPPLRDAIIPFIDDPSFTGRDTLWAYGLERIAERPWTGYGFDSFWQVPAVTETLVPFDADWDYRGIVNGHNNYIDIALFMGLPAAAVVICILCVRPLRDYARCRPYAENRRLADLCLMIIAFVALNSLLESSWFRRADPTWIMMILAIIGMRMACRIRF